MKLSRLLLAIVLASSSALRADVVTLKDGKKLEGTILEESPAGVKMKYKVTPKIWDEKVIPMADIAPGGILKEKPEEIEIKELTKLVPTADLMTAEKYEQLIQDRLRPFVNRYPGTPQAAEIQKMIDALQLEKEKVVAGGIKLEGRWLEPQEAKAEKYNIDAYQIRQAMNEKAAAGDYSDALREFDKLSANGAFHFASVYYPKAVEEALAHLTNYDAIITRMTKDQPVLQKMREDNLKRLIEPDLSRSKAAIEKDVETAKIKYEIERKETKWVTPYKYDLKRLKDIGREISLAKANLEKIDIAAISKINDQVAVATRFYYADKVKEGWAALGEVAKLAQSRPEYSTLIQTYQAGFNRKYAELSSKAAAQNAASLTGSAAVAGTNVPGTDDAVARALAMASGKPAAPGAAAPAVPGAVNPAVGTAPAPGVPVPGVMPAPGVVPPGVTQAVPPNQVPGAVPNQYAQPRPVAPVPNGYPQQAPVAGAVPGAVYNNQYAPAAPPPEEPAISMNTILMVAGGAVLLVLIIAMVAGKKKKS